MKVVIASIQEGEALKQELIEWMKKRGFEIEDVSCAGDFFINSEAVVKRVLSDRQRIRGVIIDETGAGAFMCASKYNQIICAQLGNEHSAKMTREHNNANVIALGCRIVGSAVAIGILNRFLTGEYASGRHAIRIDMLDRMGAKQ